MVRIAENRDGENRSDIQLKWAKKVAKTCEDFAGKLRSWPFALIAVNTESRVQHGGFSNSCWEDCKSWFQQLGLVGKLV
ncbi:hypothetical protein TIFTF001_022292 [Ficus carica]|uniref:Uncharacterized protein n=1 Tax=Ficus carica TaxID=3494 RepID=A0AA88DFD8_FICCA|nr:hypothetical protein TIFTF001_022292 [Ficus carica]